MLLVTIVLLMFGSVDASNYTSLHTPNYESAQKTRSPTCVDSGWEVYRVN